MLRENVHHSGRKPAVGDDADVLAARDSVEILLLENDLGVAAQIAEVRARVHSEPRHLEIQIKRQRAHHRVGLTHQRQHGFVIVHVERRRDQPRLRVATQELRWMVDAHVREPDFLDSLVLQQIVSASGTLQAGAEDEETHCGGAGWKGMTAC